MTTRSDLLPRLTLVPTEELLELLGDDAIFDLAAKCFPADASTPSESAELSATVDPSSLLVLGEPARDKAKRPLNAFMAFRSYYVKIFPDVQQKAVSGFLTTLWNKDPCRNRWALIAKVYSFARDEVGKSKVSLAECLGFCCPIMKIIEPQSYLDILGWCVRTEDDGSQHLARSNSESATIYDELESQGFPNAELDLLHALLKAGYLREDGVMLMKKMYASSNGMMTMTPLSALPVPYNAAKLDFINTIRENPMEATRELFGAHFDEQLIQDRGYQVHNTENLNSIGHLTMALPPPVPIRPFAPSAGLFELNDQRPIMNWGVVPDGEFFDLANPFNLDHLIGFTDQDAQRFAGLPPSPPYQVSEDYHCMF